MLTIKLLAEWFLLAAFIYFAIDIICQNAADANRGVSTFFFLLAQGISAFILMWFN